MPLNDARPRATYSPFGERYDIDYVEPPPPISGLLGARFGFRGMPQAAFPRGPWTPEAPKPPAVMREAKQAGDDGAGQHIFEALLGRTRQPGDAVGKAHGSAWKNPVSYIVGGLGGYAGYEGGKKIFGDPFAPPPTGTPSADWMRLLRDIATGQVFRGPEADAINARVPYPPDPNKP